MNHNGYELVSLHDFIENVCKLDTEASVFSISNEFCAMITSKYSYESNKCMKAEALDKTRHILVPVGLVLKIFATESIGKNINQEIFLKKLKDLLTKKYTFMNFTCCCCPKKLKKSLAHVSSFTEFVRQGDAELRRFNKIKHKIKFLLCLDIEGNSYF